MGDIREKTILIYVKSMGKLRLPVTILREICDYLTAGKGLVTVEKDSVMRFDVVTRTWEREFRLQREVDMPAGSMVCLQDGRVFVCGGLLQTQISSIAHDKACILSSQSGIDTVNRMSKARWGHGVVLVGQKVLVFGGTALLNLAADDGLKKYEQFNVQKRSWKLKNEMIKPRTFITPCRYGESIYLCGGGSKSIEKFNLFTHSFLLLPIQLDEDSSTLSVIQANLLIILTQSTLSTYNLFTSTRISIHSRPYGSIWSNCPPMTDGENVYIVDYGICKGVSLRTGEVEVEVGT